MIAANMVSTMNFDVVAKGAIGTNQDLTSNNPFKNFLEKATKINGNGSDNSSTDNISRKYTGKVQVQEETNIQGNNSVDTSNNLSDNKKSVENLSDEDKKFVKKLADKMGLDQNVLLNLLTTLKIDIKSLEKQPDLDTAVLQITNVLDEKIASLGIQLQPKTNVNENQADTNVYENQADTNGLMDKVKVVLDSAEKIKSSVQPDKNVQVEQKAQIETKKEDLLGKSNPQEVKTDNTQPKNKPEEQSDIQSTRQKSEDNAPKVNDSTKLSVANEKVDPKTEKEPDKTSKLISKIEVVNQKSQVQPSDLAFGQNYTQSDSLKQQDILKTLDTKENILTRDNIFEQVVENAKLILKDNGSEMEMNLKPESLGKLSLKVATENGMIVAKITADNPQVKQVLESNLDQLKDALKQQGLSVQDFSVSVRQDSQRETFNGQYKPSKAKQRNGNAQAINTIAVSQNYSNSNVQTINNPYLKSDSTINFVA